MCHMSHLSPPLFIVVCVPMCHSICTTKHNTMAATWPHHNQHQGHHPSHNNDNDNNDGLRGIAPLGPKVCFFFFPIVITKSILHTWMATTTTMHVHCPLPAAHQH